LRTETAAQLKEMQDAEADLKKMLKASEAQLHELEKKAPKL
jgi:hypothetical protein